ncbi:hypothetical protein ES703_51500 [subsurface metagenome]
MCQCFHSYQSDAFFVAGLYSVLHFGFLHKAEVVVCHNYVYPVGLSGSKEAVRICVGCKAEEFYEFAFFCVFSPFSKVIGKLSGSAYSVDAIIDIDIVGVHSFK